MKKLVLFILLINSVLVLGQKTDSLKLERALKIYRNLEYNTIAFDDLKNTWDITDPLLIRDIYNRCVVNNALKVNGKKVIKDTLLVKTNDIYSGKVFIELRKRYYDDEIELMRFYTESKFDSTKDDFFFDPITDYLQIKNILGVSVYDDLKSQFYALNDLTKTYYDNKDSYDFDINMQLFHPELMFLSLTTIEKNKYLISVFGRWGSDYLMFPAWFYPSYVGGIKLTFIDRVTNYKPHHTFSLEVGVGFTSHQPELQSTVSHANRLYNTGASLFFGLYGNPIEYFVQNKIVDKLNFEFNLSLSLTEYPNSYFNLPYISKFYSNRNYFSFTVDYQKIFNFMDMGWFNGTFNFFGYDVYNYLYNPQLTKLFLINETENKFKFAVNGEVYIANPSGLLNYKAGVLAHINFSESTMYFGLKSVFMLTNRFGVDFRFYTGFAFGNHLPYYRIENYLVFSPIIRINY